MPSLKTIYHGLKYPSLTGRVLNQTIYSRKQRVPYNESGTNILSEDWDNLIILDACRHDLFRRSLPSSSIDGKFSRKISRGSDTVEFLVGNFQNRRIGDVVYVTANPQLYRNQDRVNAKFHEVVDVWDEDGWDDQLETVLPPTVTSYAGRAAEKYPNKRLIVHFIQPHYPFLTTETDFDKGHVDKATAESPWVAKHKRQISASRSELWKYYSTTLEKSLPHVAELVDQLRGKTVVTSDHGNMIGERSSPIPTREWGHPSQMYTDHLVTVPWLEVPHETRRDIISGDVGEQNKDVNVDVDDRLEALGYT